jgi:filamentous hemagglutinin family protein
MEERALRRTGGGAARLAVVAAGAVLGLTADPAPAGTEGADVVRGDVTFTRDGHRTVIEASDGSIINYHRFDVLPHEIVRFVQPGAEARVLNRVTGHDPSRIDGTLTANGQVYLVNPAGVLFGPQAVVDVAGIVAAAGHVEDADFAAGVDAFTGLAGPVVNEGSIRAGAAHLIGRRVANHGTIVADGGIISMVAGGEVYLRRHGERVTVRVDGADLDAGAATTGATPPRLDAAAGVDNSGDLDAPGGRVVLGAGDLYSLAIRNTGRVRAEGGGVELTALDGAVHNAGLLSAGDGTGTAGAVAVRGPSVMNAGVVSADAATGRGGEVEVTGHRHTYLLDGSRVSAAGSGDADGGEVLVDTPDGLTAFAGGATVDVSGGGDGGFAEVSGRDLLFAGDVRLAGGGADGHLLIDPANIRIEDEGPDDGFLDDGAIDFDEPDTTSSLVISDEALEAIEGDITLQATRDIDVNQRVALVNGNDVTLEAGRSITLNAAIDGARDLALLADADGNGSGRLVVSAPLDDIRGSAVFDGAVVFLNGHTITTAGEQTFLAPVDLCQDAHLTSSGTTFTERVDATRAGVEALTLTGPVHFQALVGDRRPLRSLVAEGPATLATGFIVTTGHQHYLGDVMLRTTVDVRSTQEAELLFAARVDGEHGLWILTGGLSRLEGPVGSLVPLDAIKTDVGGSTRLAADIEAGLIVFKDVLDLAASVTLTAGDVEFREAARGHGFDLEVVAPITTFLSTATGFGRLRTDPAGDTFVSDDVSGRHLLLEDAVTLRGDAVLAGDERVELASTVDGPFDLSVVSGGDTRLAGDVGGATPLASLTTQTDGVLFLDGGEVRAEGDILLDPAGRATVPAVATIVGRTDALEIRSGTGDIRIGPNEKLTVIGDEDGDLLLSAPDDTVTIGDVNTLGDLVIDAAIVRIRRRAPGPVLTPDGNVVEDRGTDIIAGGRIVAPSTTTTIGLGPEPRAATPRGDGISPTIDPQSRRVYGPLPRGRMLRGDVVLDLFIADTADGLAEALGEVGPPVRDRVFVEPFALRPLQRLAIYLRHLDDGELLAGTEGRRLVDDTSRPAPGDAGVTVSADRLDRGTMLEVVARFVALFGPDASTGERAQEVAIRDTLAVAWGRYTADAGADADPAGLRPWLATCDTPDDALVYLDGLRELFEAIWIMGATRGELEASAERVLAPITPAAMELPDLERAIGVDGIG